jgi:hypothetical protein
MRWKRWCPAFFYVLATVWAQGLHDHHGSAAAARCAASCTDTRTHLSGHSAPDLGHSPADCLACQFRAEPQCGLLTYPILLPRRITVAVVTSLPAAASWPSRWIACRAPPRA